MAHIGGHERVRTLLHPLDGFPLLSVAEAKVTAYEHRHHRGEGLGGHEGVGTGFVTGGQEDPTVLLVAA